MKRINGFLNLDEYFEEVKEKENIGSIGLAVKGYIKESDYKEHHWWLKINDEYYYFKPHDNPYIELIVSECAKFLGINAAFYDLALYKEGKGVISKSYRKDGANYVSGIEILYDYLKDSANMDYLKKMGYDGGVVYNKYEGAVEAKQLNNLEIIWQALEKRYQGKNLDIQNIINNIVDLFIFNILVAQNDGEPQNWELEESEDGIQLMPFIDAELCFQNPKFTLNPRGSMSTTFNDNDLNNYEHLREFFRVSSSEYIELFLDKYELFTSENFESILKSVETKIERNLPIMFKKKIMESFMANRYNIDLIIKEMNISRKGVNLNG